MVNTTITLNEQKSRWVQAQVASGKYHDESDLFHDLIQSYQHTAQTEAALIKAESSITKAGFSQLSVDDVWAKAKLAFEKTNLESSHILLTSLYKNCQKFRPVNHQPKIPL